MIATSAIEMARNGMRRGWATCSWASGDGPDMTGSGSAGTIDRSILL